MIVLFFKFMMYYAGVFPSVESVSGLLSAGVLAVVSDAVLMFMMMFSGIMMLGFFMSSRFVRIILFIVLSYSVLKILRLFSKILMFYLVIFSFCDMNFFEVPSFLMVEFLEGSELLSVDIFFWDFFSLFFLRFCFFMVNWWFQFSVVSELEVFL